MNIFLKLYPTWKGWKLNLLERSFRNLIKKSCTKVGLVGHFCHVRVFFFVLSQGCCKKMAEHTNESNPQKPADNFVCFAIRSEEKNLLCASRSFQCKTKFSVCRSEPQNENVNFAFEVSTPNNSPQPALNHFNCSLVERKHVIGSIIPKGIMSSNAIFDLSLLSIIRAEIGARAFLSPIFCLNSDKRQPGWPF